RFAARLARRRFRQPRLLRARGARGGAAALRRALAVPLLEPRQLACAVAAPAPRAGGRHPARPRPGPAPRARRAWGVRGGLARRAPALLVAPLVPDRAAAVRDLLRAGAGSAHAARAARARLRLGAAARGARARAGARRGRARRRDGARAVAAPTPAP